MTQNSPYRSLPKLWWRENKKPSMLEGKERSLQKSLSIIFLERNQYCKSRKSLSDYWTFQWHVCESKNPQIVYRECYETCTELVCFWQIPLYKQEKYTCGCAVCKSGLCYLVIATLLTLYFRLQDVTLYSAICKSNAWKHH